MTAEQGTAGAICLQVGEKVLYKQSVVPAPACSDFSFPSDDFPIPSIAHGHNILLFVPTANQFKRKAIQSKIEARLGPNQQSHLIIHQQNIDSGVGNQPYDENGARGAYTRIRNALSWLHENIQMLEEKKIGTVVVGAIENYIQRPLDCGPAVDYGVVVLYNATARTTAGAVSRGVTVPKEFLEEAEAEGFDDETDGRKSGKVTVGEVLERTFGIDKADWQKVVCGISRYVLLQEALDSFEVEL
ncbi:hypothetical protein K432DRAFT_364633 [Lepidopterella palustris CBS 459.81]|uniref:Non-canonical purine NTP phosphatase/PRRC1 domain-containing protein n=1 Tax=Lepidopterella palustris CBS 459.81 TaxID=1314670 RepID=A0A8E2DXV3_9PEZI|nr:hypothetical protein K432DRAFT_364633 [Lepidopterella palustris CBS 459.81]